MKQMMDELRNNPPKEVGGYKVLAFRDYKADTIRNMETGEVNRNRVCLSPTYFTLILLMMHGSASDLQVQSRRLNIMQAFKGTSLEDAENKLAALMDSLKD